jgi:hypothetical protein
MWEAYLSFRLWYITSFLTAAIFFRMYLKAKWVASPNRILTAMLIIFACLGPLPVMLEILSIS